MSDLKKQLKNLDVSKIKMSNGKTVEAELKRNAGILADCIMVELDKVYDSYSSKVYERTYDLYNSLNVDSTIRINVNASGTTLSIGLSFDDGVMHQGFDGQMKNVAWLINDGFQTKGRFAHVPYLGHREATNFLEHGIEAYKRSVKNPFAVKLTKGDEVTYF